MKTKIFLLLFFVGLSAVSSYRHSCPDSCSECSKQLPGHCIECKPGNFLEKSECKPCHDSCNFCNGPFKDDCLPENLHNILSTHRLLASGDVEPLPNSVTLEDGFTLSFNYTPDNSSIIILLNYTKSQGWFAIGFEKAATSGMTDGDFVICLPGNGDISCGDYHSDEHGKPDKDSTIGGTDDVKQLGYSIANGAMLAKFERKLNTGDSKDNALVIGKNNLMWGYHDTSPTLTRHTYRQLGVVDLTPTAISSNETSNETTPIVPTDVGGQEDLVEKTHGFLIFCGWGLLIDLGLIVIAIGRKYPIYVWFHAMTAIYTFVATVVTVAFMIKFRKTGGDDLSHGHFGVGIAILSFMTYQAIAGISMMIITHRRKISNPFYKLRLSHRLNGLLLYILAKINIFIGSYMHGNRWLAWIIPVEVVLIVINVLLRLWIFYRNTKYQPLYSKSSKALSLTPSQKHLIAAINSGKSREELIHAYPKTRFAYLFNRIYDLTYFEHPGGNFIISAIRGREVGRFLFGAYQLEALNPNHKRRHKTTDIAILNRYYIGEIDQGPYTTLISKADGMPAITEAFVDWSFVKKTALSKSIATFEFHNPTFLVRNDMKGVSWFGRHYYISKDLVNGPTRPYTTCLSLGEAWTNFRSKAIECFDTMMKHNAVASVVKGEYIAQMEDIVLMEPLQPTSENITFVVKRYHNPNSPALSEFMHTKMNGLKSVLIRGPVGTGLELHSHSRGVHYVFAVGTGMLPFMDLFNFILFKSMYLALKKKFGAKVAQQIDYGRANDYETALSGGFKLVLYGAFAPGEESFGYEIIKKAAEINALYELDLFEAHVRGVEDDMHVKKIAKHIGEQFIREHVNPAATKIYICGNPPFNKQVPQYLKKLGVDPLKIVMV